MKKIFLFALLMLSSTLVLGQTAYIEVKGEPDLSVYLNSKFKGKTTEEFSGFIIENVTPGKNLIKIVKEGYTPFEETIIVKANEVLAYKVKPFTKHKVYVSEEGNTAETDKKATIKTGKLIIQSVPIEIKITIPDIDGINKSAKTKDKWQADEIPAGTYKITFTYNQKVITKTIEIKGSETTSLFVNMMNGDFKASNTLDERETKEKANLKKGETEFMNYNPSNFKLGLSVEDTKNEYPQFKLKINKDNTDELVSSDGNVKFYIKNDKVYGYTDAISYNMERKNNYLIHKETFEIGNKNKNDLEAKFKFPPYISESDISHFSYNYEKYSLIPSNEDFNTRKFRYKNGDKISYTWKKNGKTVQLDITFNIIDKLLTVIIGHNITITVIDENLIE